MDFSLLGFIFMSFIFFFENMFFIVLALILSLIFVFLFLHKKVSSHWPIFFLLLVYLGGVLMILLYLTSMTSKTVYKMNIKIIVVFFIFYVFIYYFSVYFFTYNFKLYGNLVLMQGYYFLILFLFFFCLFYVLLFFSKLLVFKKSPMRSL